MWKFFGRPANHKTSILAEMLVQFNASVESALPSIKPVTHAVVTFPDGLPLTDWESDDVLDYVHLKDSLNEPDHLPLLAATFVGTEHRSCNLHTDVYCCEVEDHLDLPDEKALYFIFSAPDLSLYGS
jgi:hypothetical protein